MTNKKHEVPAVGTHVKLTEAQAQKWHLDPSVKYTVTGKCSINRASYANVIALDVENPASFRVHPKYLIIVQKPEVVIETVKKTAHSECAHESTKSARAKCRRERNA